MSIKMRRKQYLIHPSSQVKYILMSVLPALIMGIFCTYFLTKSGEILFRMEKETLKTEIATLNQTVMQFEKAKSPMTGMQKLEILRKRLSILEENMKIRYYGYLEQWARTKMQILVVLFSILVMVGFVALLYSHRMVGPLSRLKKSLDMLSEGKDVSVLTFRKEDEFSELAGSFENLRKFLKEKNVIT